MRVLVTCPPMIGVLEQLQEDFRQRDWQVHAPPFVQALTERELVDLVPTFDGWIAGDDPISRAVMVAGRRGSLRAIVKWGIGVDNVDFDAAREFGFDVRNTPGMFSDEVADVALGYVIALARHLVEIDCGVRKGDWPKPTGASLRGKTAYVVGFGNIGKAVARRLDCLGLELLVHDPLFEPVPGLDARHVAWPEGLEDTDFVILTAPLNPQTHHMVNADTLAMCRRGVRLVNVARGPLVDEAALIAALHSGQVHSVALDVYEKEPLPDASLLRNERCILGSHNASNTREAALRASRTAMDHLGQVAQEARL